MSLYNDCRHIVDCGSYCATHSGTKVEAKNPIRSYNSSDTASSARQTGSGNKNHYYYEQVIQTNCAVHQPPGEVFPDWIYQGNIAYAQPINDIITYINKELVRRGKGASSITTNVSSGNPTQASIIMTMNNALHAIKIHSNANPSPGTIMYATSPNAVISKLNEYARECLCYTDCTNYSLCSCHGHCNNY